MSELRRLLVTGGAGFIGSNFVLRTLRERPDAEVITFDALTYAGNLGNLEAVKDDPRHRFVQGDVADPEAVRAAIGDGVDAIVHFAAESHVDRSISDPGAFLRTNVVGTQVLLDAAREGKVGRFVHVSTDEVYGSLGPEGKFTEESPLDPSSPYAASKAASDLLVQAWCKTFGIDAVITRCTNNFGPFQFPEKLIPLFITNAMNDEPLPLYGDGMNVRDWIHVEDHCSGVDAVLRRGRRGEVYNISAENERNNREITAAILEALGKPDTLIRWVDDRPGHDRRYALDASKLRAETGWSPAHGFEDALVDTVRWYREHVDWWTKVKSGEYRRFYDAWYGDRIRNEPT